MLFWRAGRRPASRLVVAGWRAVVLLVTIGGSLPVLVLAAAAFAQMRAEPCGLAVDRSLAGTSPDGAPTACPGSANHLQTFNMPHCQTYKP